MDGTLKIAISFFSMKDFTNVLREATNRLIPFVIEGDLCPQRQSLTPTALENGTYVPVTSMIVYSITSRENRRVAPCLSGESREHGILDILRNWSGDT